MSRLTVDVSQSVKGKPSASTTPILKFVFVKSSDHSDDGQEFGGSIYQKLSPKLETGIQLAWSAGSNNTKFGIGAKYDLDQDAAIRAKVNNSSQIGLGYQQRLREGERRARPKLCD
jgi:hypothetical protein